MSFPAKSETFSYSQLKEDFKLKVDRLAEGEYWDSISQLVEEKNA